MTIPMLNDGYYDSLNDNNEAKVIIRELDYIITKSKFSNGQLCYENDFDQISLDVYGEGEEYTCVTIDTYNRNDAMETEEYIEVAISIIGKNKVPKNQKLFIIKPNNFGTLYMQYELNNGKAINQRQSVRIPNEKTYKKEILRYILANTSDEYKIQMKDALKDTEPTLDDVLAYFIYYHTYPKTNEHARRKI